MGISPPDNLLPTRPRYTATLIVARLHRSPSYFRRQERRRQAAHAAVEPDGEQAGQATAAILDNNAAQVEQEIGQAGEACGVNHASGTENVNIVAEEAACEKSANKAETFDCFLCDFFSLCENGLKVHLAQMHSTVEQLDGGSREVVEDEDYKGSKHYWSKGWLGGAYQSFIDANAKN